MTRNEMLDDLESISGDVRYDGDDGLTSRLYVLTARGVYDGGTAPFGGIRTLEVGEQDEVNDWLDGRSLSDLSEDERLEIEGELGEEAVKMVEQECTPGEEYILLDNIWCNLSDNIVDIGDFTAWGDMDDEDLEMWHRRL